MHGSIDVYIVQTLPIMNKNEVNIFSSLIFTFVLSSCLSYILFNISVCNWNNVKLFTFHRKRFCNIMLLIYWQKLVHLFPSF